MKEGCESIRKLSSWFMLAALVLSALVLPINQAAAMVAQEEVVARYNGPGNSIDAASAIVVDANGNVYVTGYSAGFGTDADYATIKYDPNGNQLWVARYNGSGNSTDVATAIVVDANGNVYVTGYSAGSGTSTDYATIKYDPNGNQLWVARYNGPGNVADEAHALAVDGIGNVYVTGLSAGSGTDADYATIKYDPNGNQLWVARYNGPGNSSDAASAIVVDANGNVYVTGYSAGFGTDADYATIKYDPNGNQFWVARYNGPGNSIDAASAIVVDANGNVYVTGYSAGVGTGADYATIKYDPNGNQLWVARYNGPGNSTDAANAIVVDASGNVYVTGLSYGSGTSTDYATIKYDPNGTKRWAARYNGPGNAADEAHALALDASGNVYVTGLSYGSGTSSDYATIKYKEVVGPITHVIVVVGENHSFDNVFGVYSPGAGQSITNLLSLGIVNTDGSPGPNFAQAAQTQAAGAGVYVIDPPAIAPYPTLPQPYFKFAPDTRFPADLSNGPFQITKYVSRTAFTGDPVHRFFQMWQQVHKGRQDLVVWVDKTAGEGPQSKTNTTATSSNTNYSSEGLGFYNMSKGDAPYLKQLAQQYAISDNYHQPIMGGTGTNFIFIASGDVAFYTKNGLPAVPWANQTENPNPQTGTDNWYTQDGYAGGSYVKCADLSKPGVIAVMDYLTSLPYSAFNAGNCAASTYYLVNNYNPGYTKTGALATLGKTTYTVPPQYIPTIAESLSANGVSWKYYMGGFNSGTGYCSFCDAFRFFTGVMTTPLRDNRQDTNQFWVDVTNEATLPAVVFLRPTESQSGHPQSSTVPKFETFVKSVVNAVKASPAVWAKTAILVTMDEAGGYYDSGYIQPIDFFGDGPRIPLIAVSPFAKEGYVDHTYGDHASILKFIEANWALPPLSTRSRDRLPNPVTDAGNPYVPLNRPAIGDLMNLFEFDSDSDFE